MQIGGVSSYPAAVANPLPARLLAASVSPDVSPDITRATQAPVTAPQSLADEQSASAREEADNPSDTSTNADTSTRTQGEPSPEQQQREQLEIAELVSRDQEVRSHEQAHAAVGGQYAGSPTYTYTRGPDGKRYAVGGEVGIDTGPVANDPEATLNKMDVVIRAALAPAEPSAQDRQVAAQALGQMAEARVQLAQQQRSEVQADTDARAELRQEDEGKPFDESQSAAPTQQNRPPPPSLDLYAQLSGLQEPTPLVDLMT